jgi:hypothetical protein
MNLTDLRERRNLDFQILRDMRSDVFDFEAYTTITDLQQRRRQVTGPSAYDVSKYRFIFRMRTLTGPNSFSSTTEVGVDSDVPDYPRQSARTWIISEKIPWSPHFMAGAPVYIDPSLWSQTVPHNTLGHLAIHICRLLNWDQQGLTDGYAQPNMAAIKHHQEVYKDRPINADLTYPMLPAWFDGARPKQPVRFEINDPAPSS